jgi:hypothetical protein
MSPAVHGEIYRNKAIMAADKTWQTVWLLGMQASMAAFDGGLVAFVAGAEKGRIAGDWPDPRKHAPPDIPTHYWTPK